MKSLFAIALLTAGLQALHLNTATTIETESFITIHEVEAAAPETAVAAAVADDANVVTLAVVEGADELTLENKDGNVSNSV
jgi:hypothetical protein